MFTSFTWEQYFSTIILLLIIYYAFVAVKYFKWEILQIIGIKRVEGNTPYKVSLSGLKEFIAPEPDESNEQKQNTDIDISPLIESFKDEVFAFIHSSEEGETSKDQIISSLQLIGSKYPAIKNADCRDELLLLIVSEINSKYPNLLLAKDLERIWD